MCPRSSHGSAVVETGGRGEIAGPGAGVVSEDGCGRTGALKVDRDDLAEAMDGGGIGDFQREVAGMVDQVLKWGQGQLQDKKSIYDFARG